jgi:PAS domain S-box-containing protein
MPEKNTDKELMKDKADTKAIENKYRHLFNCLGDAIFVHDMHGKILDVNDYACHRYGYSYEKFLTMHAKDVDTPEQAKHIQKRIQLLIENGEVTFETIHQDSKKRHFPVEATVKLGEYDGHQVVLAISHDITKRKKTEEALQDSEEKHRLFFENSPVGIIHYDNKGIITDVNDAIITIFGTTHEKLIGLKIDDIPNKRFANEVYKSLNGEFGYFEGEYTSYTGKKTSILKAHWIPLIYDEDVFNGVGIVEDITQKTRTKEALKRSEGKYRYLIEKLDDIIWTLDLNLNTTYISPSITKNLGFTPEERILQNPIEQMTPSSYNNIAELLINELNREQEVGSDPDRVVRVEVEYYHKNGSILWFENIVSGLRDQNGILIGFHGVSRNISERKFAEKEKIKAQKIVGDQKKLALVGQIAGKMAHDFNNVLAVIMGNAQLALLDSKETKTIKALELIFNQTIRGKNLTRNLVAFAKDQEPKQKFFKLSEKIELVLRLLQKDLEGIEITKEEKPGMPELLADPGMIEHGLVNLIQNSIHALSTIKHPKITIRIYKIDNNLCFEIEDNGCGIPKEHSADIYEPAFTLKGSKDITESYKSDIKGTGYGMANVKKYIELHKGNIFVESKLNSGTKFTIQLPIIKKELTTKEKAVLRKETAFFEKYILLVEDEQSLSDVQYSILTQEPCNHKIDIAPKGQIAIDLFDRNEYDLISLDYILPGGINGMDVYNHIRKTNKSIPILFISGNIEFLESIEELKTNDPYVDHQSKPCVNINYVNSINKLLGI